ncbi:MAG TPA: prepilin-type N-terminal cleavage/methylation domain-containing protein [Phycisphaerales bacterium]|nr:prepilin-type N-terminal cleavage/methylation domain-containing protein [Phycisphaerales bacterium]
MPHARRDRVRAFTLIELLVVIAIIALLIGILLPTLGKARRASRQTVTLARLHDLGIAMAAYSHEYKDQLPTMEDPDEKAFLGLSLLAKVQSLPAQAFINPNAGDTLSPLETDDRRPVLATFDGAEVDAATTIDPGSIARVRFHASFAFDNDVKVLRAFKPIVYIGDRADYRLGRTLSAAWGGEGMCVAFTDQHAEFVRTRSLAGQQDPNMYHHNEWMGEGGDEQRDGVSVTQGTLDTHLRFFTEDEDDALLPDAEP